MRICAETHHFCEENKVDVVDEETREKNNPRDERVEFEDCKRSVCERQRQDIAEKRRATLAWKEEIKRAGDCADWQEYKRGSAKGKIDEVCPVT